MRINSWPIYSDNDTGEYTATFTSDDFTMWYIESRERNEPVTPHDRTELVESCIELARAESRRMTQTRQDLRDAINTWADRWNERCPEFNEFVAEKQRRFAQTS